MKKVTPFLILFISLLLVSCKSKKHLTHYQPRPTLLVDSVYVNQLDSAANVSALFAPNHSQLSKLQPSKKRKPRPVTPLVDKKMANIVVKGTKITTSITKLSSAYAGIDRVVNYDFTHRDVPEAFEGFRMVFISDLHYKSLFKEKGLNNLVRLLNEQKADVILMGGDYQEGCEFVEPLFAALSRVKTPMGIYGVLGNNDYERCTEDIIRTMEHYGMKVLEHEVATLRKNEEQILIAGIRNPFDLANNGISPTLTLAPEDFVVLLVHTPDYIEDVSVANTDLALAGHTHGGQVRVLGYSPVAISHYGNRFLTGLSYNSAKIPLIVTNGIGTSQMPVRIGAPAEIIVITLHKLRH